MDIVDLKETLRKFAIERDWERFHTPKNLTMALAGEVGELSELFQWLSEVQMKNLSDETRDEAANELADILIYLVRLFDVLEIDPDTAVLDKIEINRQRYPIELSSGNAVKYNKRGR